MGQDVLMKSKLWSLIGEHSEFLKASFQKLSIQKKKNN